jgi:methanethiol S-methyltransferase
MTRILVLAYGLACYLSFGGVLLCGAGFLSNRLPRTIGHGGEASLAESLAIDVGLLILFGLQHSGMARPAFKRWWTRLIPAVVERSTYVLLSSLALGLLFWQWRPIGGGPGAESALGPNESLFLGAGVVAGTFLICIASFQIGHFEQFGLRQVYRYARGQPCPPPEFRTPGLYRVVRHPMMLGLLLVLWLTPPWTADRLLFAGGLSLYVLIGVRLEERDLVGCFGQKYEEYRRRVPQFIPTLSPCPEIPELPEELP